MKSKLKKIIGIVIFVLLLVLLTWSIYSYLNQGFIYDSFSGETSKIIERIDSFKEISSIIFVLLIIFECVFAPFPPLILYIAGGAIFGWFNAGILAVIGNFIGAAIAFQLSRNYARDWTTKKVPENILKKLDNFSLKYGALSIFILRLNPLTSSDLFSYAAGLTKMSFKKFLLATTLALIPTIFLQTYLGEKIQEIPHLTEASIFLGILYILGFFYLYFMRNKFKK